MFYLIWSDYTRLAKHVASVALPADLIPRFEAAQDSVELVADTAQS
jgi:hypothetical protein